MDNCKPCLIKNISENFQIYSGNRGYSFPYNTCELVEELCYLAVSLDDVEYPIIQASGEILTMRCLE